MRKAKGGMALAAVLAVGGLGVLAGCHEAPSDVCAVYKPHSGDTMTFAAWDGPPEGQQYGGRYLCSYSHPGGGVHHICILPPEHYPPPDDHWAKINDCSF